MSVAVMISGKSIDPSTKCGCVAVDKHKNIISVGYNNPPRDCIDEDIPLTRPEKYAFFNHAEENCIINASRMMGSSLDGTTLYVTSHPCATCFRMIRNAGIDRIVYLSEVGSKCVDEQSLRIINQLNAKKNGGVHVRIDKFNKGIDSINKYFNTCLDYLDRKTSCQ